MSTKNFDSEPSRYKGHESPRRRGRNNKGASTPKVAKRIKKRHKQSLKHIRKE